MWIKVSHFSTFFFCFARIFEFSIIFTNEYSACLPNTVVNRRKKYVTSAFISHWKWREVLQPIQREKCEEYLLFSSLENTSTISRNSMKWCTCLKIFMPQIDLSISCSSYSLGNISIYTIVMYLCGRNISEYVLIDAMDECLLEEVSRAFTICIKCDWNKCGPPFPLRNKSTWF